MSSNQVTPTPAPATQNDSDSVRATQNAQTDVDASGNFNLHKAYSRLNESLTALFDKSGVRRSFTVPYVDGQPMADHIKSVGAAARQTGGLTKSLVTSSHSSDGKGWGSGDGATIGHPSHDLRKTTIMPNDENAKASLAAAQKLISNIASLLGKNDSAVKVAQGQLDLIKHADGAGMNLLDFGSVLIQIVAGPLQAIARRHNDAKSSGPTHPLLQAPRKGIQPQPEEQSNA